MLDTADLAAQLSKDRFHEAREAIARKLGELQRQARDAAIPILLVFDGWQAAGLGTVIGRILAAFDPRGYKLHTFGPAIDEAALRPPMWRYWVALPPRGGIGVYDGSWYGDVLRARKKDRPAICDQLRIFERQQTDDGAVVVKIWLHIGKKEQAKRFKKLEDDKALAWRITPSDWRQHDRYETWWRITDDMLEATSTEYAPWTVIPSENLRYATIQAAQTVIAAIERALKKHQETPAASGVTFSSTVKTQGSRLDAVDLNAAIDPDTYQAQLEKLQDKLLQAEHRLYPPRIPVVIVYEGWDASGKGGNIRRLVASLDHRGFEVIPVAAPAGDEKTHHYLWRFWRNIPKGGHITIFDRSWYGRVLVERVEKFATPDEWARAYNEINEFETQLTDYGIVLVKFWIHLSKEEQLHRFQLRQQTPWKTWKITEEDWRNREKWDQYHDAVDDMLQLTSTPNAPWTIVEGNQKYHARIKTLTTVLNAINARLANVK